MSLAKRAREVTVDPPGRAVHSAGAAASYAGIGAFSYSARRVLGSVRKLAEMPHMGRPGRVEDTREPVVPDTAYIIAYTVLDEQVVIIAVPHSAQKWPDRF